MIFFLVHGRRRNRVQTFSTVAKSQEMTRASDASCFFFCLGVLLTKCFTNQIVEWCRHVQQRIAAVFFNVAFQVKNRTSVSRRALQGGTDFLWPGQIVLCQSGFR